MEMQWRQDEEKCANELLQTQLDEIQVRLKYRDLVVNLENQEKLNTHVHVCVYAEGFTAKQDLLKKSCSEQRRILTSQLGCDKSYQA